MKSRILLFVLLVCASPLESSAQVFVCLDEERLTDCYVRLYNAAITTATVERPEMALREEARRLANASTGANVGAAPSTLTDLLPLLSFTGLVSNLSDQDESGVISGNLNLPVFTGLGNDLQIKATLDTKPDPTALLFQGLSADDSLQRAGRLQDGLPEFADFRLDVAYNATRRGFGRSLSQYRDWFQILFRGLQCKSGLRCTEADVQPLSSLEEALLEVVRVIQGIGLVDADVSGRMGALPVAERTTLERALQAAALADERAETALEEAYSATHLDDFYRLVNNQPQITGGLVYHHRNERIGQSEFGLRVGFEVGFANVNKFEEAVTGSCGATLRGVEQRERSSLVRCLDAYSRYVEEHRPTLDHGDRLFVGVEYARLDDYLFRLPGTTDTLSLDASNLWKVGAGYGRYLDFGSGSTADRVDVVLNYEGSSSPMRNDRFVTSLTITRKVAGMTVPLGIVYANKGEFLGEVDARFGANLGVKLDLGGAIPRYRP